MKELERIITQFVPWTLIGGLLVYIVQQKIKQGHDERKAVARILPELLEIRHSLLFLREFPKQLPKIIVKIIPKEHRSEITEAQIIQLVAILFPKAADMILPDANGMEARFNKALEEIAVYQPLTAFRLRGKERVFNFRELISGLLKEHAAPETAIAGIISLLDNELLEAVEDTILTVAKAHSAKLHRQTKKYLRTPPVDLMQPIKRMAKEFAKHISSTSPDFGVPEANN